MLFVVSADDKRRSFADLRDSSLYQTKEKLSVSVKAMSALYLSKVAPQESANTFTKQVNSCVYSSLADVLRHCILSYLLVIKCTVWPKNTSADKSPSHL